MDSEIASLAGQVIRSYELREVIGVGGFGIVYQAYQSILDRDAAIKVIRPQFADQTDFIRHFEGEAQIIAHLEHPYIVPLYDFWREPGGAYLVMRWLRGGSLRDMLSKVGALPPATVAKLLDQIAEALAVAHHKGVVHQDIKPENILLDEYGNAYLTDFGIAKGPYSAVSPNPQSDGFGTAAYAAPEQISRKPVTAQTDIYSLGMMIYELLMGQAPFMSASEETMIFKQLHEPVPLVERENVSIEVSRIIWRATAKLPEERYQDVLSFAEEFRRAVHVDQPGSHVLTSDGSKPRADPGNSLATRLLFAPDSVNPYKGLQAFSEADTADFFGREALIDSLVTRLRAAQTGSGFLALVGPSGSGKSSVVQAGILPRLRRGEIPGSERWFITQMNPATEPFLELEAALLRTSGKPIPELRALLREVKGGLAQSLEQILPDRTAKFVLVIDQFEELFTLVESETERKLFLQCLLQALEEPHSRLQLILTLRADFYDRPLLYAGIGELLRDHTEIVLPLSIDGLQQAIVKPAERSGVYLEAGLLSMIVEDVHRQPSALPLLQHVLTELYNQRKDSLLTQDAYRTSGGVVGALARRADEIYEQLDAKSQNAAQQIFLHLVTPGNGTTNTSRRVLRAELVSSEAEKPLITSVLDAFGKHRLLTFDYDPASRSPTVQIAHEAIIQVWERLQNWLIINRADLRQRQNLAVATDEWIKAKHDPGFLATGSRLSQFEALPEKSTLILNEDEKHYVRDSIALRRRGVNRLRSLAVVLAIFSVVALILAVYALNQRAEAVVERDRADTEAQISRSRELAVTALTNQGGTDLSLLLSLEALDAADTFEARNSLLTTLQSRPHLVSYLHGHTDGVRTVVFSPDGHLLASGGRDNQILLWDATSGQATGQTLSGHTGWINALAFSPDGKTLASASEDHTLRLWDVATGAAIGQPLTGHTDAVRSVTFSPDGKTLASASADSTIRFWDVATGAAIGQPLTGHTDVVWSVAFSPDGKTLASGSADQTLRLWDVATRQPIGDPLTGHQNWVLSVAFSPNGKTLASGSADNTIMLWDVSSRAPIGTPLTGDSGWVRSIAFSPDGTQLVSGSVDKTVRLWDVRDLSQATQLDVYQGHTDAVWSVAFAPNGHLIASASADKQILLWNTVSNQTFAKRLTTSSVPVVSLAITSTGTLLASAGGDRTSPADISLWTLPVSAAPKVLSSTDRLVTSLAFSPDGQLLASGSLAGGIHLWNLQSASIQHEFLAPNSSTVYAVAFSPDGRLLAAATDAPNISVWDVASGALVWTLTGHTDSIYTLAFSPDGQLLASGSRDNTIRLWNIASLKPAGAPLVGHTDSIISLAFSPDGKMLASGSRDVTIRLWDVASGQADGEALKGHSDWVTSLAFSPDGQLLASGSQDDTVRLWDVSTQQALGLPFTEHTGWVNSLVFSAKSRMLITGGQDGAIILRNIGLPSLENVACQIANRNLTAAEWQRYFPKDDFHQTCVVNAVN